MMYAVIFILLTLGFFLTLDIKIIAPKSRVSLSKKSAHDKRRAVDEKFARPGIFERIAVSVKSTAGMCGMKMNTFYLLSLISGFLGIGIGKALFSDSFLSAVTGAVMLPVIYIVLRVKARWYVRNQDELLENTMNLITNSYLSCNDIITAVNENLDKIDIPGPFEEFITDVTLIDSNIRRALRKLEMKIHNKYFAEWIDILVIAQEKSGDYRFVLPAIIQSMNDTKRLRLEADTVMMSVWKEYFTSIVLAFSIIPILRWSNNAWFDLLVSSVIGKLLIFLMLVLTIASAFITLRINKPL
ncbi:MAG: hypothetical protein PUE13_06770 [Clostridiales bacterium]|nr:hypothetical protein [Clostridiales bacterium]